MAEAVAKETRESHPDTQWQRHLRRSHSRFDCTFKSESNAFKSHFTCYILQILLRGFTYFHQENLQMKAEKIEQTKVRNEFALSSSPEYIERNLTCERLEFFQMTIIQHLSAFARQFFFCTKQHSPFSSRIIVFEAQG